MVTLDSRDIFTIPSYYSGKRGTLIDLYSLEFLAELDVLHHPACRERVWSNLTCLVQQISRHPIKVVNLMRLREFYQILSPCVG